MSSNTSNRNTKNMEEIQAAMQALIAQGRKEGMLQASDLNAQLEKLDLSPEKIEEIYDRLDAMNIQVVSSDLDLEVDSDLDSLDLMDGLGDEVDLSGIPEEDLGRLTEAFYMVDKSRSRAEGGAGLGLSVCQRIVSLHGGTMEFESTPGQGTRVRVHLKGGGQT